MKHSGGRAPIVAENGGKGKGILGENGGNGAAVLVEWSYAQKGERTMRELEERIRRDGIVEDADVLKVDSFLNHQMDVALFAAMGREWARLFAGEGVNKILTIEASGIGIACVAAQQFGVPVVFAKKSRTKNIAGDVYQTEVPSFTHGGVSDVIVSRRFLGPEDRLLLIDDFLANGAALEGLLDLARQAGASVAGAGVAVEKAFQSGGARIRARGVRVEALARIKSMTPGHIEFC